MGAFLDKPKTEKYNESGSAAQGTLRYGLASMQGWRVEMEDAHIARTSLPDPLSDTAFFAVFDGHAGAKIAKHSSSGLLDALLQTPEMKLVAGEVQATRKKSEIEKAVEQDAAEESGQTVMSKPSGMLKIQLDGRQTQLVAGGMKSGFLAFDERMRSMPQLYSENERSGATAISALVTPSHIFLTNLGDSRAVLSRGGRVYFATEDHKPYLPKERERIINAGGSVMIQRVNGSLAVSRALGDYDYKSVPRLTPCQQLVSPEPDVYVIERERSPSPALSDGAPPGDPTTQQSAFQIPVSNETSPSSAPTSPVCTAPTLSALATPAAGGGSSTLMSPIRASMPAPLVDGGGGGRDEFLILACDGIFDVITNQELCDFIRSRLMITNRLELICNQILDSCLSKGSKDNMSIILITFPGAPQVSTDAVARDQQFEFYLRERIQEIVQVRDNINDIDVDFVLRALMNQEIPGLPPGAGIHAMRTLVESTLEDIKCKRKLIAVLNAPTSPTVLSAPSPTSPTNPLPPTTVSKKSPAGKLLSPP